MSYQELPVGRIIVRDRARHDVGDLTGLKQSIADLGLLQAVGVTEAGVLVFGGRRLEAMRQLGWKNIPVKVLSSVTDALTHLRSELDENMERLPFTAIEAADLRRQIRALRAPARRTEVAEQVAAYRRSNGTFGPSTAEPSAAATPDVDTAVQAATGFSPATLRRVERIRAFASDENPEIQAAAKDALEDIAGGAPVNTALETILKTKNVIAAVEKYPALEHVKAEPVQVLRLEKYLDEIAAEGDSSALQEELDGLATMWSAPESAPADSAEERDAAFEINQLLTATVAAWTSRDGAGVLPHLGPSMTSATARSWRRLATELATISETIRTSVPTPTGSTSP